MAEFFLYLVESSAILLVFYLIFVVSLRRETFFTLNRFYLIAALGLSVLLPFINVDVKPDSRDVVHRSVSGINKFRKSYHDAMYAWEMDVQFDGSRSGPFPSEDPVRSNANVNFGWFLLAMLVYVAGLILCLVKVIRSLIRILKMIRSNPPEIIERVRVVRLPFPTAPFSFFRYLFVHTRLVETPEFRQIMAHEKTHIRERHSIDLIFVQVLASVFWFNPVVWRLAKSLKSTHEYIADKHTINSGYSLVEYQTLLLQQLISNNSFGLVHNFNLSFIKKRITMMTNKPSGWAGKVKVAGAIVCTLVLSVFIVQCNSRIDEALANESSATSSLPVDDINVPVVPEASDNFKVEDLSSTLHLSIKGNQVTIDGTKYKIEDIASFFEANEYPPSLTVVMRIDRDQTMGFVRKVDWELRKAERRKLLYVGQSENGNPVQTAIVLPPTPENARRNGIPVLPDMAEVEAEGNTDILKIDMGEQSIEYRNKVYDFVEKHSQTGNDLYVVSAFYKEDDTFDRYLTNLILIKEGFYQLYQERAQKMFAKDFFSLGKEEKLAARVPMNISIAEK